MILTLNLIIINFSKTNSIDEMSNTNISGNTNRENKENKENKDEDIGNWYIEISSISLKAPIKETTNKDILNKYIGHFDETAITVGNIGLAAHNRGYEKNYFENLKKVKKGEEIKYKYYDFEKIYIVDKIEIIKDTDWRFLEKTNKNKVTLITCVENKSNYRLCVQATEK